MSKHYVSTGTIRLKIEGEKIENIFFVPNEDHRVKHQGKEYAVFLPKDTAEDSYKDAKVASLKKCLNNSVELTLSICNCKTNTVFNALLDAATKGSAVDVKVKCKKDGEKVKCKKDGEKVKLKLIGITVPALSVK